MHGIRAALMVRNYRLYVTGGLISLIGTWMQRIGVGWLMWELTHSGTWLGLAAMADLFPGVVVGPVAGALADRLDRLRVIRTAQVLMMIQGGLLFLFTRLDMMTPVLLLMLVLFGGLVVGVNQPARLALIPSLVPRSLLGTAVAINAVTFNLARFIGPAAAGIVILRLDVAAVFLANALSFVAFLVALWRMRFDDVEARPPRRGSIIADVADGLRYTVRHPGIGPLLLMMTVLSLGARPFVELLPGLVGAVWQSGAEGLATISSAVGLGAVASGIWMAQRGAKGGLTAVTLGATAVAALTILGLALSPGMAAATACAGLAGVAMILCGVGTQTLLQIAVAGEVRGRVLGLYGIVFRAGPAAGAFVMGLASEWTGLQAPLAAGAILTLAVWAWLWRRRGAIGQALESEGAAGADG